MNFVNDLCGLIVPGNPVIFSWVQLATTKLGVTLVNKGSRDTNLQVGKYEVEDLKNVREISLFFLPGAAQRIPNNAALALYYSTTEPYSLWTIIGAIKQNKESAIFSLNLDENIKEVRFGLAIESVDLIENLEQNHSIERNHTRESFGIQVAEDIHNFLGSFSESTPYGEKIIIPANALDRWLSRFKNRYFSKSLDPQLKNDLS